MPSPVEAGLRLIAERLGVPAALLFAAAPGGALRVVGATGTWRGDALQTLAEALAGDLDGPARSGGVLDVAGVVDGARFAAGARLGQREGALLVAAPDDRAPDADWHAAFAASAQLSLGLVRSLAGGDAVTRVLHEVAVHPGAFDERLALALVRLADTLGLDAAAFARAEDQEWRPEAVFDPSARLVPTRPVPLGETFCAFTVQSDGPFAVPDGPASPLPVSAPGAYLGAPIFVGGRCAGTLSAVGHGPRARAFGDADRALIEALARWVGSALGGLETARRLAAREADLSAFFDAAPMGIGIARLVQTEAGDDLEIVAVNRAAAALLGTEPDRPQERPVSGAGAHGPLRGRWLEACRRALDTQVRERFEAGVDGRDGTRTLAITVAPIAGHEPPEGRLAFVVEDTTEQHRTADRAREREAQVEALVSQAPLALFATDRAGRLAMSRGHGLDLLGLSVEHALGRPVAEVFGAAPGAGPGIEAALAGRDGAWTLAVGGRSFRVRVQARRDGAGRPAGLIGVALDTTGLPAPAASGAGAPSPARSELLRHLDREIRSPLTSILGYADLLSERTPPDEVAEVRDVIGRSGERLLGALDDLLDLTLLDDDAIAVHPTPVHAGRVVAGVAEASRPAAEANRLALNLWCTLPEEPVLIDARLFERVVRHLVSSAVAAATGNRVDVRLRPVEPGAMELSVLGSGPPAGSGSGAQGMGIGPDLVRRLVRALGGTSRRVEGDGGGWVVRLPRRRVPVVDLPAPGPLAPPVDVGSGAAAPPAVAAGAWRGGEAPVMDRGERAD